MNLPLPISIKRAWCLSFKKLSFDSNVLKPDLQEKKMSRELLLLVDALAREKSVQKDIVFIALEMALASATKKRALKKPMCA